MKKTFGIIFLIIGLIMIVAGIAALTNSSTRNHSYEGQVQNEFSQNYRSNNNQQQAGGGALIVVGLVFFVLGIVMVATKSEKQRLKETELKVLKSMQATTPNAQPIQSNSNSNSIDELTKQALNFYKQKEYTSAIAVTQRALTINPTNYQSHFNLACLYSVIKNQEAFNSLSKAVEYGYSKFDKINTETDLQWLREQPSFDSFLKNGYKLKESESVVNSSLSAKTNAFNDDIFTQLEKLSNLKEQGIITEDEFIEQKKKVLNN